MASEGKGGRTNFAAGETADGDYHCVRIRLLRPILTLAVYSLEKIKK